MSVWILPYKGGSKSVDLLKNVMGIRSIKLRDSEWRPQPNRWVLNWGNTTHPLVQNPDVQWLNHPEKVKLAVNKLDFLKFVSDNISAQLVPIFTTNRNKALEYLNMGYEMVARHMLNGYGGAGITLYTPQDVQDYGPGIVAPAPLYTIYVPKKTEYRVHYVKGEGVIKIQRKARDMNILLKRVNWKIRNSSNGFIFVKVDDVPPDHIERLSEITFEIMMGTGLDFGAVDILWTKAANKFTVLEVNTAPGLSITTASTYAEAFKKLERNNFMEVKPKKKKPEQQRMDNLRNGIRRNIEGGVGELRQNVQWDINNIRWDIMDNIIAGDEAERMIEDDMIEDEPNF